MDSLIYLLFETLIVGLVIIGLYASKKHFGIGLLYVFLGTVQFFQTILSSSVYNLYLDSFVFSPGSALIYTSTLFAILLIFKSESVAKVRSAIYGVMISNIVLVFLSYISLEQILVDSYSRNTIFLSELFNFDINLFITGTVLLYFDFILILFLFSYVSSKFPKNYFLSFLVSSVITSIVDSFLFYSLNYYSEFEYFELLVGNMFGKTFVCLVLSSVFSFYYFLSPPKERAGKKLTDIFTIINFVSGKH